MTEQDELYQVKSFTVTVDDGSLVEYTLRGLRDDEISKWAAFCASVFAYKANPPLASYFERHYRHDPFQHDDNADAASLIRVVFCQDTLVASCRIFQRHISTGNASSSLLFWLGGGIGEVCTDEHHRRRGLSKLLLQDAIQIMTQRNMQISLLHAAPAFFPVYESVGYSTSLSKWSVVTIDPVKLTEQQQQCTAAAATTTSSRQLSLRLAKFPNDTERLQVIHQVYSEQRFAGCIVRSTEYWNEYISHELEGSLWVLTERKQNSSSNDEKECDDDDDDMAVIVAWMSVRQRGDRYQVRDFGCDANKITTLIAFPMLLEHAMSNKVGDDVVGITNLHLPTFLLEEMGGLPAVDGWLSNVVSEDDQGWMYKSLIGGEDMAIPFPLSRPHLIWPADSF